MLILTHGVSLRVGLCMTWSIAETPTQSCDSNVDSSIPDVTVSASSVAKILGPFDNHITCGTSTGRVCIYIGDTTPNDCRLMTYSYDYHAENKYILP